MKGSKHFIDSTASADRDGGSKLYAPKNKPWEEFNELLPAIDTKQTEDYWGEMFCQPVATKPNAKDTGGLQGGKLRTLSVK